MWFYAVSHSLSWSIFFLVYIFFLLKISIISLKKSVLYVFINFSSNFLFSFSPKCDEQTKSQKIFLWQIRATRGRESSDCILLLITYRLIVSPVATWRTSWFFSNDDSVNASPPPLKLERPRSLSLYSEEERKQRNLEMNTVPTPVVPDNQTKPFVPVLLETEKTEKNVQSSPSCSQEVATGTNQHGHLDLKFYHSPLWWNNPANT